jgi:alpha-L-rhamnosidase
MTCYYKQILLRWLLAGAAIVLISNGAFAQLKVVTTLCENRVDPLGVPVQNLHFGWESSSQQNDQYQTAYQLVVATSIKNLKAGVFDAWNSAVIKSDESVLVPYLGKSLKPGTVYYWQVRVWDKNKKASVWSRVSTFCTGLENAADWKGARWVGYEDLPDDMRVVPGVHFPSVSQLGNKAMQRPVVPNFRKEFATAKKVARAYAFISGLGQYELTLNGRKAGEGFLTPGWTYYDKTCLYNVLDVTGLLKPGTNAIGVTVGNGFYNINRERYFKFVGAFGMPKLICRIKLVYTDGTTGDIISDQSWKTAPSAITYSSIYGGEDYDARLEQQGWNIAGFNDAQWKNVELVTVPKGILKADPDYPVAVMDSFKVQKISEPRPSVYVYDFGQNISGILELKVKGHKGQTVKLIPSEILTSEKLANQEATGGPYYLSYTLKGDGIEVWRPKFTYYGFRYVQVEGALPTGKTGSLPVIEQLTSLHTRNSSPQNGTFNCSNKLFNRIYTLINWAIKSNYQSVITDCPHREKLSWLEQDYLMGNSIHYNLDNYALYRKLVFDLIDAQSKEGFVPDIAPEFVKFDGGFLDSPEWGSSAVILPWQLYTWYGDKDILRQAYPMMQRYVAYLAGKANNHILNYGLGDWFDYGPKQPGEAQLTPKALTATAIYYYDVMLLGKMASVLNKSQDAAAYQKQAIDVKEVFNSKFFNAATKVYSTGSQTAMAMPLSLGLVNEDLRSTVLKNLTDSIKQQSYKLTAGDIGFHFLINALDKGGQSQVIYDMNNRDDVPGYGYQLKKGATALTESWPALENVSNNHLMLGHIMEWFYSGLAGIAQEDGSTGFKQLSIRPQPVGNITSASGTFHTPYGWVKTNWKKRADSFHLVVIIPPNTKANVYLPLRQGMKLFANGKQTNFSRSTEKDLVKISCGSGNYIFDLNK